MRLIDDIRRDLSTGVRLLARSPGFAVAAIATLAIAIGANTAVFTVVNALLFVPVPVADPSTVVRIDTGQSQASWPNYEDIRAQRDVFTDVMAHRLVTLTLASGPTDRVRGESTSPNFFTVLGIPAARGRTFADADRRADVIVLSDRAWRTRFGADASAIGRTIRLGGRSFELIGVMPPAFRGLGPPGFMPDFWIPVDVTAATQSLRDRMLTQFQLAGRLAPSVGRAQATAALRVLAVRLRTDHPDLPDSFLGIEASPVDGIYAFEGMASLLLPVFAFLGFMTLVSGFVLVAGCANIAGLLVSRAAAREREIAVRLALGARRRRLMRQLLTENLVLAIAGGAAGVLVAIWLVAGAGVLTSWLPVPVELDLRIDRRVLGYAVALSTVACLFFGLGPAWNATRVDLMAFLRDATGTSSHRRLRRLMVVGQVTICTALLIWSALFVRSLAHVGAVDPGFDAGGVMIATTVLEPGAMTPAERERIFVEWVQRVAGAPGVESAGLALVVPLALTGREDFSVSLPEDPDGTRRWVVANRVTPGWFETLRIPLVAGRDVTWDDRDGTPYVAVVNETLAHVFWNGRAVGQRIRYGDRVLNVVGVVRDSKYRTIGEAIAPTVYLAFRQVVASQMTLHVRATDMNGAASQMMQAIQAIAPDVPVQIERMADAVAVAIVPAQIGAMAIGGFGIVAMLLSTLGVYGLVSFSVAQRTREIGIRQATGATTSDIVRLVVLSHGRLVATGLVMGGAIGVLGAMVLRGFLTSVSPADPASLLSVGLLVVTAALTASALPAWRAARANPLEALRDR